jgi:hypothetical protein
MLEEADAVVPRLPSLFSAGAGALLVSQAPAFADHYLQSLGGRLDQARLHAARIVAAARDSGLAPDAYLARLAGNEDAAVRAQAGVAAAALEDAEQLGAAYSALTAGAPGLRPLLLVQHLDGAVARATAARFSPALPLSAEGLIYAALGGLAGFLIYAAVRRMWRMRARREATADG